MGNTSRELSQRSLRLLRRIEGQRIQEEALANMAAKTHNVESQQSAKRDWVRDRRIQLLLQVRRPRR